MNNIEITNKTSATIDENYLIDTIKESLTLLDRDNTLIEILFVSNDEIQTLNKKHRGIDKPTDVLSFPQSVVPTAKIVILGSIVIAPDVVKEKNEQMADVVKHGLLHLLGLDHEEDEKLWDQSAQIINCAL